MSGTSYNIYYEKTKPKSEGICDKCNAPLVQRNDDNEESFKKRFTTFLANIEPVLNYYKSKGTLKNVKVEDEKHDTYKNVEEALND